MQAKVIVIAASRINGEMRAAGWEGETAIEEAKALEGGGYVEIISIDGKLDIWCACCTAA